MGWRVLNMPGQAYEAVVRIAVRQHGYVTTAQAREHGVDRHALKKMANRGNLERVSRGLYRVPSLPYSEFSDYMEAVLWPEGETGVVSHESALSLFKLSDVSPDRVHITLPTGYRIRRRQIPRRFSVHYADLESREVDSLEGVPVTTPERALRDCHEAGTGARLLRQAIEEAEREGYLSPAAAVDFLHGSEQPAQEDGL